MINVGVRQEKQQHADIQQERLPQADAQPPRNQRHAQGNQSAFEQQRVHHADPGVVCNGQAFEHPVEQPVEDYVPGQRQYGNDHGDDAHFQHRFVHDPGQQRRTDQNGQQFETNGLENTFSDGFVGAHGLTP
ncbi:hypothetical protein D3C71_1801170 [compost metagenome]